MLLGPAATSYVPLEDRMSRISHHSRTKRQADLHNDVVDGDVDQLDKESDEPHDGKADRRRHRNLLELLSVRLCAPLHKPYRIFGKLPARLYEGHDLVHGAAGELVSDKRAAEGEDIR